MTSISMEAPRVPVIGADNIPLMACHSQTAQKIVRDGKAVPFRVDGIYCIKMKYRKGANSDVHGLDLNIASGPKTTNLAVTADGKNGSRRVIDCLQILHQTSGGGVQGSGLKTRHIMKSNRSAKIKMWDRRTRGSSKGNNGRAHRLLPPVTTFRRDNIVAWADTLAQIYPVSAIRVKSNRLNAKLMVNPATGEIEYEHNTLRGWQIRAYIFERDWHRCAYCDNDTRQLQIDHMVPQSSNGSNGPGNLVMCCSDCNQKKADRPLEEFLAGEQERLDGIYFRASQRINMSKKYLNDMMPSLVSQLGSIGLPVSEWDSATTSWNRKKLGLRLNHCFDAALVGRDIRSIRSLPSKILMVDDLADAPRRVESVR